MAYTITCQDISKIYKHSKDNKTALNNLSFSLTENKIYGLIGSNGAGKTTLLRLIANHILPSSGQITFNNTRIVEDGNIQQDICFMADQEPLFNLYNIKTLFEIASSFYTNWDHDYAKKLVNVFGLNINKKYSKMSKGEKGKANIIIALASKSKITILDETYVSLDAPSRRQFFDLLIEDYTEFPRTIIISTHYIDEVSNIFEEIILINAGQILLQEPKNDLEEKSLTILGDKKLGENLLQDVNIIHRESFGGKCAFSIYDTLSEAHRKQLNEHDFQISITPVEKWFVHMISEGGIQ